jgi:hypothetical protein
MNRCKTSTKTLTSIALCAAIAGAAGFFPLLASAQDEVPRPQTQNESLVGGRNFPIGTLRGKFTVVSAPDVELDGKADRLGAGARIRSEQNMLVMPGAIVGQRFWSTTRAMPPACCARSGSSRPTKPRPAASRWTSRS